MPYKAQQMTPLEYFGHKEVLPKLEVGIEVECEGNNLIHDGILSYWNIDKDGSLRGDDNAEYILKKPVQRDKVRDVVEYLAKKLKEHGARIDQSIRTSTHIHLNMQDRTFKQIYTHVVLYMIVENLMADYCGPRRAGNLFCLRSSEAEFVVQVMQQAAKHNDFVRFNQDNIRYASCNLAALGKYGSLEFRAYRGTLDPDEITRWVTMLLEIKDKAKTYADPVEVITDYSRLGPAEFLRRLGPTVSKELGGLPGVAIKMHEGMRLAQEVAFCTKWLPDPKPEAEKKEINVDDVIKAKPDIWGFDRPEMREMQWAQQQQPPDMGLGQPRGFAPPRQPPPANQHGWKQYGPQGRAGGVYVWNQRTNEWEFMG